MTACAAASGQPVTAAENRDELATSEAVAGQAVGGKGSSPAPLIRPACLESDGSQCYR